MNVSGTEEFRDVGKYVSIVLKQAERCSLTPDIVTKCQESGLFNTHAISKMITSGTRIRLYIVSSGGSRNFERGVQLRVHEAQPKIFGLPRPLPDVNARVIIVAS